VVAFAGDARPDLHRPAHAGPLLLRRQGIAKLANCGLEHLLRLTVAESDIVPFADRDLVDHHRRVPHVVVDHHRLGEHEVEIRVPELVGILIRNALDEANPVPTHHAHCATREPRQLDSLR
jgi:hypothetical protein